MVVSKLFLTDTYNDDYKLIAIHSSLEAYKLAFFINRQLEIQLKREEVDVDFTHEDSIGFYPLYYHYCSVTGCDFNLVANKCRANATNLQSNGGLFPKSESGQLTYLVPEYKWADYFFKIDDFSKLVNVPSLVESINTIKQVVTAYEVVTSTLKSKQNLIFN